MMTLLPIIIACLIAFLLSPLIIHWYTKQYWLDDPKEHKHVKVTHIKAVPRGGGLIIFGSVLTTSLLFLQFDKYLVAILIGAAILTVVGFIDDLYDISPIIRLISGFIVSLIIVGAGIGIAYVSNPLQAGQVIHLDQPQLVFSFFGGTHKLWILSALFAIIFINWNMNALNWSKGVDGQLPSFVVPSAIIIGILSSRFLDNPSQFGTATLSFIVAGAYLGFLFWNWYPQKILPGYGAGSLAGFFLSVLAILSGAKLATFFMVLAIPSADAIFTIARRLAAGKSPFWGDRGHLHHKMMDLLGWQPSQIALFYCLTSIVLGMLSLYLNTTGKILAVIITTLAVFLALIIAKIYSRKHNGSNYPSTTRK